MSDIEIIELLLTPAEYEIDEAAFEYGDYFPTRPTADLDYLGEKDEWN